MVSIRSFDFQSSFADLGGATSDLFRGFGDLSAASSYRTAAGYAKTNAQLEQESLNIQQAQIGRQVYQTIGGQKADVAGAGFSASGSALDLLRDSTRQGSLALAQNQVQGEIKISNAQGEVAADQQQAQAAEQSATGNFIGSALQVGAALLPLLFLL